MVGGLELGRTRKDGEKFMWEEKRGSTFQKGHCKRKSKDEEASDVIGGFNISRWPPKRGVFHSAQERTQEARSQAENEFLLVETLHFAAAAQFWGNEWEFSPAVVGILLDD